MDMRTSTTKRKVRPDFCDTVSQILNTDFLQFPAALNGSAQGIPRSLFLGESSVMFYMNGAKQKLLDRQVLGAVPVSGSWGEPPGPDAS